MYEKLNPIAMRDWHGGRNTPYSIDTLLAPPYTVSDSTNVNFDTIIGPMVVRSGTTKVGATVIANRNPLGLDTYVSTKGTIYNRIIAVFSGASNATVYYNNGTWNASNLTSLSNTARVRFAMLGNQMFLVNGATFKSSSDGGATWGTTNTTTVTPGVIIRAKQRILVSGDTRTLSSTSRVYFSTVIDPTAGTPGTISFTTDASAGNWIDINPDDGDSVTAFANTSTYTLVFKNRAMYRLDVINKSVDTDNIFNMGAPSQEAVVSCQGIIYFFSGLDIRSTTGDFPINISRLGVQDFIDAITLANWTSVFASTDSINVYFDIGTVTLNKGQNSSKTYNNVRLKFSPRDQSWSVHSYAQKFQAFANVSTITVTGVLIGADTLGNVQVMNNGTTDNGTPIFFEAYTQELEFGNREFRKTISNQMVFFTKFGRDSFVELYPDERDAIQFPSLQNLDRRISIVNNVNVQFNYLRIRWFGNTNGTAPIFQGFSVVDITSEGIIL